MGASERPEASKSGFVRANHGAFVRLQRDGSCLSDCSLRPSIEQQVCSTFVGKRSRSSDKCISGNRAPLLLPLVLIVVAATAVQGVTSFALTQLLSKAAQRMIADLRRQVQAHIGRLSPHDTNKTGALVARNERRRRPGDLVGTGLVELVGSLMTASFALVILLASACS